MKLAEMKMLCKTGSASNPLISRTKSGKKWLLTLDVSTLTTKTIITLHTKRGKPREFSSLDGMINTLDALGIDKASIQIK